MSSVYFCEMKCICCSPHHESSHNCTCRCQMGSLLIFSTRFLSRTKVNEFSTGSSQQNFPSLQQLEICRKLVKALEDSARPPLYDGVCFFLAPSSLCPTKKQRMSQKNGVTEWGKRSLHQPEWSYSMYDRQELGKAVVLWGRMTRQTTLRARIQLVN